MYFTSQTFALTSSHKFESSESLYKFQLQASNLYYQWHFMAFNFYKLKLYEAGHSATAKKCAFFIKNMCLLNWPQASGSCLWPLATLPCSARTSLSWLAAVWHVSLQQEWSCWFGTQFLGTLRVVLLKYNMYNYKFLGSCPWQHVIMVKQPTDPLYIFLRVSFLE